MSSCLLWVCNGKICQTGEQIALIRVYYACDLHGSETTFLKFVNAARLKVYKAKVVIAAGDLTGKALVPIVDQGDGTYAATFLGSKEIAKSKEELQVLCKHIRNVGYYYEIVTKQRRDELLADSAQQESVLHSHVLEEMDRWIRIAEERLKGSGVTCYLMPGNDDTTDIGPMIDKSTYVVNPEDKVLEIGEEHEMISTGYSNPTPWKTPRECSEEELKAKIDSMASKMKDPGNSIFNFHCPPYGTGLDLAPQLDEELRPTVAMGELLKVPVGSTAVLKAIEQYQPLVGMHGHIHESYGEVKIGRTMCFNSGSEYQSGILRGYVIDLEKNKVKQCLHVET
jgi:Icc-related predicted phosphoesterase